MELGGNYSALKTSVVFNAFISFSDEHEPPILDVLRADVSVELPAQYGATRPGVPCAQRLARDVEVFP